MRQTADPSTQTSRRSWAPETRCSFNGTESPCSYVDQEISVFILIEGAQGIADQYHSGKADFRHEFCRGGHTTTLVLAL